MEIELRTLQLDGLSFDDDQMKVSGYVNKTGQPSAVLGSSPDGQFREIIQPGVFSQALLDADVVDFYNEHDPHEVLATTSNGTLQLVEDNTGLYMQARILPTSFGKDTYELIKSGVITGMSFGMKVLDDEWSIGIDGVAQRTVKAIKLIEVSAVRHPAYPDSTLEARGIKLVSVKVPKNLDEKEMRAMAEDKPESQISRQDVQNLITVVSDLSDRFKDLLSYINESRSKKVEKAEETRAKKQSDEKNPEKRDDDADDNSGDTDSDVETDSKDDQTSKKAATKGKPEEVKADSKKKPANKGESVPADDEEVQEVSDDKDKTKPTNKKSAEKRSIDDDKLRKFIEFFDSDLNA